MHEWPVYTAGRLLAIATRPLCLFIANNYLVPDAAQGVAVAFLASALVLAVTAASPHRRFYSKFYSTSATISGLTFYLYAASIAILIIVGSILVLVLGLHFTDSLLLATAASLYFVSEKLADELLRLRLFEREFAAWGRAAVARSVLQLTSLVILITAAGRAAAAWPVVAALAASNIVVFVPQLPFKFRRNLRRQRLRSMAWLGRRAAGSLRDNWLLWMLALVTSGVGYLDRLVALILDKATLPLFMLVVMCFSIVQLVVDYYYVSRHRRDFLEQRIDVRHALTSGVFLASFGGGLLLASAACIVVLYFSRHGADFPVAYVLVIATVQMSLAVAQIPQEILYWKQYLGRMLNVELVFWALFTCAGLGGWWLSFAAGGILALVAACVLVRLVLYLVLAARAARSN